MFDNIQLCFTEFDYELFDYSQPYLILLDLVQQSLNRHSDQNSSLQQAYDENDYKGSIFCAKS